MALCSITQNVTIVKQHRSSSREWLEETVQVSRVTCFMCTFLLRVCASHLGSTCHICGGCCLQTTSCNLPSETQHSQFFEGIIMIKHNGRDVAHAVRSLCPLWWGGLHECGMRWIHLSSWCEVGLSLLLQMQHSIVKQRCMSTLT